MSEHLFDLFRLELLADLAPEYLEARSFGEMLAFMGLADRTKFRRKYIHPLLEASILELTIPEKPNSRNQKYRLTAKGIALKNSLTNNK